MLHLDPLDPLLVRGTKKNNYNNNNNNIGRFPGGGLENQNPARTIAHSPPGVKETLNYMLREKMIELRARRRAFALLLAGVVYSLNI